MALRTVGCVQNLTIRAEQRQPKKAWRRPQEGLPNLNFPTIFGSNGRSNQVSLYEQFGNDGGPPRIWSPCVPLDVSVEQYMELPVMFYLPGFDGSGIAATRQFPLLMKAFDFMTFTIPIDDRTPFVELVDIFISYLKEHIGTNEKGRPVYLLGESFGALLALAAASKCPDCIDRLVLVNPATSYEQSIWPIVGPLISQIPNELYTGLSFALAPLLGNPLSLIAYKVDASKPFPAQMNDIVEGVLELFGTLGFVGDVFTPERVAWKIKLVEQGFRFVSPLIPKIQQRTLLIVGEGDWMLPSGEEKDRLARLMQRCYVRSMGLRSHALLQEGGVDLVQILKEEGFYVTERRFTTQNGRQPRINAFGTPDPIELPTEIERQKAGQRFSFLSVLTSPVFYSTTEDDKVVAGLDGIPDRRPVLIVGNHQLMAPDTFLLVEHLVREKGILLRGLSHPLVVNGAEKETKGDKPRPEMGNFLTTFGAVRVSAKNLYKLLQQGERILLYPGGARESFKLKNEKYQLFWPETAEFVRMAAKFDATIVTLAAVGIEESMEIVMDREDIMQTPILGDIAKSQIQQTPEARLGVSAQTGDVFLPPLIRPKVPQRQYFLFGQPFQTSQEHYKDKEKGAELYKEIKSQLERNLVYLQEKAKEDPYRDFVKRIVYENSNGRGQAPSFVP